MTPTPNGRYCNGAPAVYPSTAGRDRCGACAGLCPYRGHATGDVALVAAELRTELIAAEREFICQLLRDGRITDEARRRIERELDLEEAGIACKKEGGAEPPL